MNDSFQPLENPADKAQGQRKVSKVGSRSAQGQRKATIDHNDQGHGMALRQMGELDRFLDKMTRYPQT
jgi:hypothetical protein